MDELYIGLMSGTSLDGIDGVLMDLACPPGISIAHAHLPLPAQLRGELLALNAAGPDELHRAAVSAQALARAYAEVAKAVLSKARVEPRRVKAIGAHGQTVRHRPDLGYTLQLNAPALLAELTGIDVVADFRSRDLAAGGQGAPLVPAFHQALWGHEHDTVAVLNIGGMANLSILLPGRAAQGFDCGPGNALMDAWCEEHCGRPYDDEGRWAAGGRVDAAAVALALDDPFFKLPPPKSTGRDLFNRGWLSAWLARSGLDKAPAQDVQACLCEVTARGAAQALQQEAPQAAQLVVCGGGAFNRHLMRRLQAWLPTVKVSSSAARGLDPMQVEAAAFAWLAQRHLQRAPGNLPGVTGATGPRVLGALYPA